MSLLQSVITIEDGKFVEQYNSKGQTTTVTREIVDEDQLIVVSPGMLCMFRFTLLFIYIWYMLYYNRWQYSLLQPRWAM